MKEKVLILGVSGFTGRHFVEYISKNNLTEEYDFFGADSCVSENPKIQLKVLDLTEFDNIRSLLIELKPEYIINLIGTFTSSNFTQLIKINVGITENILSICALENIPVKRFLLLGSAAEYGLSKTLPIDEN